MESTELWGALLRLLICLPLVLLLAYVVLRMGVARRSLTSEGVRRMRIVEQLPLGPKTAIVLLEVGERCYLLGVHEHGVNLLKEYDRVPVAIAPVNADGLLVPDDLVQAIKGNLSRLGRLRSRGGEP